MAAKAGKRKRELKRSKESDELEDAEVEGVSGGGTASGVGFGTPRPTYQLPSSNVGAGGVAGAEDAPQAATGKPADTAGAQDTSGSLTPTRP
jgi:hypothetical protein